MKTCDKFEPIILEGQLCYRLKIEPGDKNSSRKGQAGGLFFFLDPHPYNNEFSAGQTTKRQPPKILISTLGQYMAFEAGAYAMRTLKKMTTKDSFEALPDATKKCQVHNFVDCQNKKYLEKVRSKCGCTPWALTSGNSGTICSPKEESCVKTQPLSDKSCLVPCTGLYADVSEELFLQQLRRKFSNSTEKESEDLEEQRLNSMREAYNRYKRDYVKQIWFDPKIDDSSK